MKFVHTLRPRAVDYPGWEQMLIRLLFGLAVMDAIVWDLHPEWAKMPNPNGIARLIPFGWMAQPGVMNWLKPVVALGLLLHTAGVAPLLTLLPAFFAIMGAGAVWASQREGAAQHSVQLIAMIVLGQMLVLGWQTARGRLSWRKLDLETGNLLIRASLFIIAATYVACGFMKLKKSGLLWFQKGPAMAVQTIKTNLQGFYSDPDTKLNPFIVHDVPRWFADHAILSGLFFGVGLVLEIAAFLMLCGRRWSLAVGAGLLAMHLMIFWLTTIKFTSHIHAVAIFCLLPGLAGLLGLALRRKTSAGLPGKSEG
jgi:uncharacterized membrane protein (UPF0136 family)